MSERITYRREKLRNYSALEGLNGFLERISENAGYFDIISATERRCYNIVVRFLPYLSIVSNNALLLMYREIADSYEKTGELPKVLIIDDIMIHGRGLSKFLYQFETVIIEELKRRNQIRTQEDYLRFSMHFTKAVTIYIYAKNSGTLLLAPRFLSRISPWKEMNDGNLRNLSMQLSDCLSRWDIANTSYAYSIRSKRLADDINALFDKAFDRNDDRLFDVLTRVYEDSQCSNVNLSEKWIPVVWKHNNERMYLFIRLYGKNCIERISTIRYFPDRQYRTEPLITSYTILGDISIDTLDSVCRKCAEALPQYIFLRKILLENNERLRDVKGQLLNTLLDIVNFGEFCETTFHVAYSFESQFMDDLNKIARNYSISPYFFEELKAIASSQHSQVALRDVFALHLYKSIMTLIDVDITHSNRLRLSANDYEKLNRRIDTYTGRSVYFLGAEAEKRALIAEWNPNAFWGDEYNKPNFSSFQLKSDKLSEDNTYSEATPATTNMEAEYDSDNKTTHSAWDRLDLSHGVLPMRICAKDMARLFEKKFVPDSLYCFIASFITVMDNAYISVRQWIEDDKLVSMVKAGEMAVFHVPSRLSLFIPAFVEIEEKYYGNSLKLVEEILNFVEKHIKTEQALKNIIMLVSAKEGEPLTRVEKVINASILRTLGEKERFKADLITFYKIGHTFRSWNFLNITSQNDRMLATFQAILADLARRVK